ncbi:Zn-ribbon domain-containing OB-fold protein [candidate division KSB1 bacterium]|nr:Zn-ribbon domain-containing OB-fold protein [candidate division KSB1 bacterium]
MASPNYWRAMPQRYRYEAQKCTKCGKIFFPPRLICSGCKSREFEKINLSREGKIVTFTVIRIAPSKFTDQAPYPVAIVELKEGLRICTQIADCDIEKIEIGMPVQLEFRRISEEGQAGIINYGYKAVPIRY